jgi:AcrR family transcriptional regulator
LTAKESLSAGQAAPRKLAAEKLREVASQLFYKHGIRAVGVDEIVNETGVTKPTLYRSYASKDELVSACLLQRIEDMRCALDAIASRHVGDPAGEIRAIVARYAELIAAPDFRGCPVTNAAVEFPENDHPVRGVSERAKAAVRTRMARLTRQLGVDNPDTLADGLMLLIEGACTSRHTSGSRGPSAALIKAAEALLRAFPAMPAR